MHEAELKLPKTMMAVLCSECDWDATVIREIEVIGFCHSGTVSEFVIMDNPSGHVRIATSFHQSFLWLHPIRVPYHLVISANGPYF
ncbi:unnamed protein product [Absidia cylindrospora]